MPIRITGLNSGLDTEAIISALVSSYNYKTEKYKKAQTKLSWKQDAWKALNTKIYSLYTSLDSMRFSKNYNLKKTTCSDPTKALVTATSNAVNGTQKLNILQVAQAGYLTGGKLSDNVTTGTTMAELGYTGGDGKINLTLGDGTSKEITVSQGTTVNDFINSLKEAGVNASYDSTNKRIFVSSKETGLKNDFTLTGANVDGASALSKLGLNINSGETQATYESYAKYITSDGKTVDENVAQAIKDYQDAKAAYDTANAKNGNLSAAYGYASAYSAMEKALKESGLSGQDAENLKKLVTMTPTERVQSVMGADGTVYTAQKNDADDSTIYSYKDADGSERYIKRVDIHTDKNGTEYKLDKDNGNYTANGKTYKATGEKDSNGNVIYANTEDANDTVTITTETKYYDATAKQEGTGFYQIKDADGAVYTENDDHTYAGKDGKLYRLDGEKLVEVTKDADGNPTDVVDGKTVAFQPSDKTEIEKTVYTQGAERADVKTSSDALTELKEGMQTRLGLEDEDMTAYMDKLSSHINTVNTYEKTADTVLNDADADSRVSIANAIKTAYADAEAQGRDGAQAVNEIVNQFGEKITANKQTVEDSRKVMDEHKVLADIAAMEDGTAKDAAVADFITKVQTAKDILSNPTIEATADAKKIDGQDAIINLNGIEYTGSSNAFSINGLSITAQGVTGADEKDAITITTQTDTQGIYDKVKDFLTQYNSVINEIASLYNAEAAKGYEPLSDEEKDAMSDAEVEKWEQKIKDALLRRDSSLDGIMSAMTTSMSKAVEIDGKKMYLADFGIKTLGLLNAPKNQQYAYHIDGDEDDASVAGNSDRLMEMITSDPDKVIEFMQKLTTNLYESVDKKMKSSTLKSAYTVYNDKEMDKEYRNYTELIKKWEEKLKKQEDYYYDKFAAMEKALAKLNSQTSSLGNLFGGM